MKIFQVLLVLTLLATISCFIIRKSHSGSPKLPSKLIAGEIHYSRIPVEYWEHRLLTVKAMGFNALSVYIMWNYHEVKKGVYDYQTENKNLKKFLDLSQKLGFYVMIRPGPYVCAEWDFGGLPARLLNVPNLKIRANNAAFLAQTKDYFVSLAPILRPYLSSNGGPIVLLQIENEYGFYGTDKSYIEALRQMWWDLDIKTQEYYVDTVNNIYKCHWSGANIGINDGISEEMYTYARTLEPKGMIFGGQIYSGWLTHWGQSYQGKTLERYVKEFQFLLSKNHSFSMYMVHGGTNFGLTAGANSKDKNLYTGTITTYDYEAPINEQGSTNEKFTAYRDLVKKYLGWQLPDPPKNLTAIDIPAFKPYRIASLFSNLGQPAYKNVSSLYLFESNELQMYNQGMVVYQTVLTQKKTYQFSMTISDFAIVYLDDKFITTLDRSKAATHSVTISCDGNCKLYVLVQAMGHINFDHQMETDFKGAHQITDKSTKFYWDIYKIQIDSSILDWRKLGSKSFPALSKAEFNVSTVGDTYINVKNYKKGYVWVNGRNLGRYWNIGPSQKVFCPGTWLREGGNTLYILDLLSDSLNEVTGDKTLK